MGTVRQIFCILLVGILPAISFGQFNKLEHSDSLFKFYKPPVINKEVNNRLEKDDAIIYFGCYFTTDTSGRVTSLKLIPFHDIGNEYGIFDSIWQNISTSIEAASRDWVFKPDLWEFKNDKVTEEKLNKRAFQRPFNGRPNYLVIFEVSGVQGSVIQKISFENYFKVL